MLGTNRLSGFKTERTPSEVHECFQPSAAFALASKYSMVADGRDMSRLFRFGGQDSFNSFNSFWTGDYQPAYNAELWEPSGLALDKDQKSLGDVKPADQRKVQKELKVLKGSQRC